MLVSKLNPRKRTICIAQPQSDLPTLASSEFVAIHSEHFEQRYSYYVWLSEKMTDRLSSIVQSATRSHQRVNPADVLKIPWKWPPQDVQVKIAAFLDEKTEKIDALIEKKRQLLERLAEKRQAIITQAVTKGLHPFVIMKDSGIGWLGQIPAHWEVVPFERSISKIAQGWSPLCQERERTEGEWGVLRSGCVNEGVFRPNDHKALPPELDPRPLMEVHAGDLLMCRASGSLHLIGSAAFVESCPPKLMFSDKTYRLTVDTQIADARFTAFALNAKYMREQIILSVSGAGGLANNIPQSLIKAYDFARPPLKEQKEISQRLLLNLPKVDRVLQEIERSEKLLQDYRSALITAAVTGQIEGLQ